MNLTPAARPSDPKGLGLWAIDIMSGRDIVDLNGARHLSEIKKAALFLYHMSAKWT